MAEGKKTLRWINLIREDEPVCVCVWCVVCGVCVWGGMIQTRYSSGKLDSMVGLGHTR